MLLSNVQSKVKDFSASHAQPARRLEGRKLQLNGSRSDVRESCIPRRVVVLVSAGMELIVFLVAGIVLCFGISMRIMLITLMFSVVAK